MKQKSISDNLLNLITDCKVICVGGNSPFLLFKTNSAAGDLNIELQKISDWAFQWKMKFNPDPKKQTQEVISSSKINKIDHTPLYFNENFVKSSPTHKHLAMVLYTKLNYNLNLKNLS